MLTSHNLEEIEKVSDRVAILSNGVIKKIGTPEELKLENDNTIEFLIRTKPKLLKEKVVKLIDNYGFPVTFIRNIKNYTYLTTENEEVIPDFTEKLISDGIAIYELKIKEKSLEEIFMTV